MPAGAISKYKPEYLKQVEKLCLLGATDEIVADFFHVTPQTLANWKNKHPELFDAIKKAKVLADATIADSLYNRAKGYEWDETQAIKVKTVDYANGKRVKEIERIERITVHRVVPPDTTAAIFWLKNRQKDQWREKNNDFGDQDVANITSVTFYPKALPRGYYKDAIDTTDDNS